MILLILLTHLLLLVNTRFTLWPEMVVYPYLINHDFLLYQDIINPYPPLFTYFLAAFAKIFGYYPLPYQILTWVIIIAIDLMIFYITTKLSKKTLALASTAFFAMVSLPFGINGLWFDLIQTPFILLSLYFFLRYLKSYDFRQLLYSAIFLTTAFFIKQNVLILAIWFTVVTVFKNRQKLKLALKNLYIVLPILIIFSFSLFFFWQKGTVKDFLYWVFYFPYFQASTMPGYILLPTIKQMAIVIILFTFFLPLLVFKKTHYGFIITTAIVTLTFAYPRFDYFHLVPSLAILSIAMPNFKSKLAVRTKTVLTVSALILIVFFARYLSRNLTNDIRFFEKDIFAAADFLKTNTGPGNLIYIQNGPDQLLPLADRLPPKPWADEFPWYLEKNDLQGKIISSLESSGSRFVVFRPYETKGQYETGSYRPKKLADFLDQNYQNLSQIDNNLWFKIKK